MRTRWPPEAEGRPRAGVPGRDLVRTPPLDAPGRRPDGGDVPPHGGRVPERGPREADGGTERRPPNATVEDRPAEAEPSGAPAARGGTRGPFLVLGVLAAIGCLQLLFMIGLELNRTIQHREAIATLEGEVAALEREAQGLRAVIEHGDDPAFREQLARKQGFMYPSETRVIVVPQEGP